MKKFLLIVLVTSACCVLNAQNQNASTASLETRNFVLGSTSIDTLYGRNLIIELPNGGNIQNCHLKLEDITSSPVTIKDTLYPSPYTGQPTSGVYSLKRAGNNIVVELDNYSLLNRHRLRFYFVDDNGIESAVTDMEF